MKLGIRTRLYGGFAALVVLAGGMGGFAYRELAWLDEEFETRGRIERAARELYTVNGLTDRFLGQSTQYRASPTQEQADAMKTSLTSIKELSEGLVERAISAERQAAYVVVRDESSGLAGEMPKLVALAAQIQEDKAKLFTAGDNLTKTTNALIGEFRAGEDAALAAGVESSVLLVRVSAWRFLATKDPKGVATFGGNVTKAEAAMAKLRDHDLNPAQAKSLKAVEDALSAYAGRFQATASGIVGMDTLFETKLKPQATRINTTGLAVRTNLEATLKELIAKSDATMNTAKHVQLGLLGLILLAGASLAFLIARSIIAPIRGMTDAMNRLAGGDTALAVPSQDATDEMGEIAKAVEVFRQNAIARAELEARQAAEQSARQRRADRVDELVRGFEQKIAGAVGVVTSAATELDATARSMNQVARSTNDRAVASSAAAEQTSANVQTVAAAAEEMVASLQEIERQVQQSNAVAAAATREAQATDTAMASLAEAAERIGEAVTMISSIAGQTNLLALNATIEAARAGEAGRGFAVVATEVKELAGQTARATDEIGGQITAIQQASAQAVAAIRQIGQTIASVSTITGTIAATVVEQTAATGEISRNAMEAARGTQDVSMNVSEVLTSANETGTAAQQVLMAAGELATQSVNVKREVDDFLTAIRAA